MFVVKVRSITVGPYNQYGEQPWVFLKLFDSQTKALEFIFYAKRNPTLGTHNYTILGDMGSNIAEMSKQEIEDLIPNKAEKERFNQAAFKGTLLESNWVLEDSLTPALNKE